MKYLFPLLLLALMACQKPTPPDPYTQMARSYADSSWTTFREFLSLPNDAHFPDDIMRNVEWCETHFGQRGFTTERLETETVPLLLAGRQVEGAERTILFYLQLDGQPVDSIQWNQASPWQPVLKEKNRRGEWKEIPWSRLTEDYDPDYRIFGRATADAKGPVMMFLLGWDALLDSSQLPSYNVKVIMDFEEEMGSPHLPQAVKENREALAADALLIFDGPRHLSNQPTLSYGARGIADVTLTVYGPRAPQHSGHYGNYLPNPAVRLAELIASFKDDAGRVTIPGWYDGIELTPEVDSVLANVPDDEREILRRMGVAAPDSVADSYQAALQYPSLNVRGLSSGWVGDEARTIIPAEAIAEIDIRLVKESDPERLIGLLRAHCEAQGYRLLSRAPTERDRRDAERLLGFQASVSYQAFRTPLDSEVGDFLRGAMTQAFGEPPIEIRTMGGSIPISPFVNTLDVPAVVVPTVNRDNNQHSPNENLRVGNYVEGIKTLHAIFREDFE